MRTRAFRRGLASAMFVVILGGNQVVFAQAGPQHPQAARRVRAHRITTHRQNVGDVRRARLDNVADRRHTVAAARRTIPRYQPAVLTPAGTIALPPALPYVAPSINVTPPPVTIQTTPPGTPLNSGNSTTAGKSAAATRNDDSPDEAEGDSDLDSDLPPDPFEGSPSYKVARFEDEGTTVVLKVGEGEIKARMIGVASVELGQNANLPPRAGRRLPSTERYMENLLKGESVHIVYDSQVDHQDADGKYMAYLYRVPDGLMINLEVVRAGFAVTDTSYDFDQKKVFTAYEKSAKEAERGIHGILERIKTRRTATPEGKE